jgi:hypothetical protein
MTNHPSPVGTARARLGNAVRFHGPNSPEVIAARQALITAKIDAANEQVAKLKAELDETAAAS